jgi:D-serine deaminase-like pyridoxal phosphate-dependent protein
MGYEGHLMAMSDRSDQATKVRSSMAQLVEAFDAVRSVVGESCTIVSAGGTGTFDLYDSNDPVLGRVTEVQAGSYALMDTQYMAQRLGFHQAVVVIGTVVSIGESWYVADFGRDRLVLQ